MPANLAQCVSLSLLMRWPVASSVWFHFKREPRSQWVGVKSTPAHVRKGCTRIYTRDQSLHVHSGIPRIKRTHCSDSPSMKHICLCWDAYLVIQSPCCSRHSHWMLNGCDYDLLSESEASSGRWRCICQASCSWPRTGLGWAELLVFKTDLIFYVFWTLEERWAQGRRWLVALK